MAGATHLYPFMSGGAAAGTALPTGALTLTDLTALPRFGLKGAGSADWLTRRGVSLPDVNRCADHGGLRVLRLGREDILVTGEDDPAALHAIAEAWHADAGAKGYWAWREEGWTWMRISGSGADAAMQSLCAVDLRTGRFASDAIAQTRVAHIEAVTLRSPTGYDVFFDITASAFFARAVAAVAKTGGHDR